MAGIGKSGTLAGAALVALALAAAPVGLSTDGGWSVDGKSAWAGPGNNGGGNNGGSNNGGSNNGGGKSGGNNGGTNNGGTNNGNGNTGGNNGGTNNGGTNNGGTNNGNGNAGGNNGGTNNGGTNNGGSNAGAGGANNPGQGHGPGTGVPGLSGELPPGLADAPRLAGGLNAAGASESAFSNATDTSTVGQLRAYREAVLANDLAAAAAALSLASNKPITAADIEQVNEVLGITPEQTTLSAEDIEAEVEKLEASTKLP